MDQNPLSKWFRQPGIHVKLPSNGKYNPPDFIDFAAGSEVAIYPMTAADEIIVTNPDSLLNGAALERIIQSCCPAIKNARDITVPDADVIILASKLVSYGDSFALQTSCPKCKTAKSFSLSIRALLEEAKPLPNQHMIRLNDDLVAYLRPYTLESNNKINVTQFEESKRIQNLESSQMSEAERSSIIVEAFQRVTRLTLELLSNCILKIAIPGSIITDQNMIQDFISNASRDVVKKIRDSLEEFTKYGLPKTTEIECDNAKCGHKWDVPIVYDPSSFFVSDS